MQVVIEIPKEVLYDTKQTIVFSDCWNNRERIYRLFRRKWCFRMEIEKRYKMLTDT